jgi:TatD DNase family protein
MFIDTHCHLNFDRFDQDRDQVVQRAAEAGVSIIINPAIDLLTSREAIQLAERYSGVYAMVGVHPNESEHFDSQAAKKLRALASHPKVVAIGEIGLDYYWDRVARDRQRKALEVQLALAAELDLPVVIHCRDAHADLRDVLRKWVPGAQKARSESAILGVLHAYSGDLEMAYEAFDWAFVLSLGGPVTFRNARQLHGLVAQLPLKRLMLETDAPFLTPHPFRGQRNEPAYVPLVARSIADLLATDLEKVAAQTTGLALCLFWKIQQSGPPNRCRGEGSM